MNKSKLVILIRSFSSEELKRFNDFLKSPYYNKNDTLVRYFTELKKHYPDFLADKVTKELIYEKLFKGKKYNEQVMRNLTTELNKLCKEFLIVEFNRKDLYENKLNLLKQMIPRKADSIFLSELKIFESELKQVSEMSERNFYYLYQLEDAKIGFHLERNEQPLVFNKILKSGEYLILFFLLNLTKTISNLNVNKQSFNVKYDTNLTQEFFERTEIVEIINYMKVNGIEFSETAELYYYRIICNMSPYDETHYFKFKELVLKNLTLLNRIEVYGLFNALEIYCLFKINSGNSRYNKELFDVFNLEIEKGFYRYSESSPVTYMKFRNTYLTALSLKKLDWVEKFIANYKEHIIESDRESVIKIAYAMLDFERGNFEKVLESIALIKTKFIYLKIDVRNLTLMSFYELGYTESALQMIDSFKHFVSESKAMTDVFKENHYRFVNSLYSLIMYKEKDQTDKLLELKEKLMDFRKDRRASWLIDKIDEILKI